MRWSIRVGTDAGEDDASHACEAAHAQAKGNDIDMSAVFSSGAKSSVEKPRFDLIPLVALRAVAARFAYGAERHGANNYEKGANDPLFVRDRCNHLIEHAMKAASGDTSEDHLGAVLCNAAILLRLKELKDADIDRQFGVDLHEVPK